MTTTDEELDIYTLLNDGWNTDNCSKPKLYYKDDIASHDYRTMGLKVYQTSAPDQIIHGLGATSKEVEYNLTIDLRGPLRDSVDDGEGGYSAYGILAARDEVIRILDSKRTNPTTNYDILDHDGGSKRSGYQNFYHYTIEVRLTKYRKSY